jgi:hypothetical protein
VGLVWAVVTTAELKRAIAKSGKVFRKPRFWERGRDKFGLKTPSALNYLRPATRWEREHPYAWIVVATMTGPPRQRRAWLSSAAREADGVLDLDELTRRIKVGEEPAPDV